MLDRCVALARGEHDVVDRDVVLQVDEALEAVGAGEDAPQHMRHTNRFRRRGVRRREQPDPAPARYGEPRSVAVGKRIGEARASVCRALHENRTRRPLRQERRFGHVIADGTSRLREELDCRRIAARDADEIAIEPAHRAARRRRDVDAGHAAAAASAHDRRLGNERQAKLARPPRQRSHQIRLGSHVDDRGDFDVDRAQRERSRIGAIVVREDHGS
jgi:hypothetical protein